MCCNGFCGCSLYASTVAAGVLGIVQSIIYTAISIGVAIVRFTERDDWYKLSITNTQNLLHYISFKRINTAVKTMIIITLIFNLLWLASSIALLACNKKRKPNAKGVVQWVVVTGLMIVCEIAFSIYFISIAADQVNNYFYGNYFFLDLAALSRGYGVVIGWSCNIPLSVFAYRRYKEIRQMNNNQVQMANDAPLNVNQMSTFASQQIATRPHSMAPPPDPSFAKRPNSTAPPEPYNPHTPYPPNQSPYATEPYNPHTPYPPNPRFYQQENQPGLQNY